MSTSSRHEQRLQATEQAAGWLQLLQTELSAEQRPQFVDWLRESPTHVAELLQAARLHNALLNYSRWSTMPPLTHETTGTIVDFLPERAHGARTPRELFSNVISGHLTAVALILALFVLACFAAFMELSGAIYSTSPKERTQITLADGSTINLAPDTSAKVRFSDQQRVVQLNRGEALFHVTKDPKRPFIVVVANTRVRAVGTVFDVGRSQRGIVVTVVEGQVSVSAMPSAGVPESALSLKADQQVLISLRSGTASPLREVDAGAEVAWATDVLEFHDETVNAIVERFNRYNALKIGVIDAPAGLRRVTGTFILSDPGSFVAFVNSVAGVAGRPLLQLSETPKTN